MQCGEIKEIVQASNPVQGAIKAFSRLDGPIKAGTMFRISEKGFDPHDDDFLIATSVVIKTIWLASWAKKDLEKS